ncbi:MAG: pseudouridine synthase [Isosphaeraceae bacterium]|nr:pseudouridine synthase [Isosphaeraceae bacterium]
MAPRVFLRCVRGRLPRLDTTIMPPRHPPRRGGSAPDRRPGKPTPARRPPAPTTRPNGGKSPGSADTKDRLQKALAHAGVGSRRACEELILQGRVTVDGKVVRELGTKVDPRQSQIAVDGQKIHVERLVYYAVNKPKGYVSTNNDPSGRPRVVDLLPEVPQRVYTVGRLDEMSTGLMLLTNDGELANRLAHPKFGVEKLYRAVVAGTPDQDVLTKLTEGVWLAEGKVRAKRVRIAGKKGESTVLELVLAEGKNREVRRMLAKFGHKVMTLTRTAVGPITLKGLAPGAYRTLSAHEVDLLQKVAAGIAVAPARHTEPRHRRPSSRPGATNAAQTRPAGPAAGRKTDQRPNQGKPPRRPGAASQKPPTAGGEGGGPREGGVTRPQEVPPSQRRPPRPESQGPPSQRRPPRPEQAAPSQRRPPRPESQGPPSQRRPPRPEQAAPSQRRPPRPEPQVPPSQRRPAAAPAGRRIIGLNVEPEGNGPRRPRPKGRPKPPRSGLGPRRPRPPKGEPDES